MKDQPPAAVLTAVLLMLLCSAAEKTGVRLEGGEDRCSGILEILAHGIWMHLSTRTFDIRAAMVVCRELDCGNVVNLQSSLQDTVRSRSYRAIIDCTGQESEVSQCILKPFSMESDLRIDVACSDSVRLVDGAGFCAGRVEVKSQQSWTTVCESDLDWKDAEVVCRELNCGTPLNLQGALFGDGKHPFGTKDFRCEGSEKRLLNCPTSAREENVCTRGSAVGLTCSGPDDVRLVGENDHCAGTVEMFYSGKWWRVRSEMWSRKDAAVVCRQLGCGSAVATSEKVTNANELSVMTDCEGSEPALRECAVFIYLPAKILAAVTCSDSVRLVDGAGFCSGRVEVKSQQSWTTVCDSDFDWKEAEVVCRELGCGTPLTLQGALFGEGKHPFGTKEFQCEGSEKRLVSCRTSARKENTCTGGSAVGLTCSEPHEVRLVGGSSPCAGTVEMLHGGWWRRIKGDKSSNKVIDVVCRQLDCGSAVVLAIESGDLDSVEQGISMNCAGSESVLRECTVLDLASSGVAVAVICSGLLKKPTISLSTPIRVSWDHQGPVLFRGHNFTISCSAQPQYPGGTFHLRLPWNNRTYTQPAVNHSASFHFPAADDSHQGNYSCIYENQMTFFETGVLGEYFFSIEEKTNNFSSESEPLSLNTTDYSLKAVLTRTFLVLFLMSITCSSIYLIFKKFGHYFVRNTSGQQGEVGVSSENMELVFLEQNVERRRGENLPTDLEEEEEEDEQTMN